MAKLWRDPRRIATARAPSQGTSTAPGLGMDAGDTEGSSLRMTGAVMHCAASISFDLPLDEARTINVEGTREIIALAHEVKAAGGLERFIHVSHRLRRRHHRGTSRERSTRRRPGVPQHLRADQVGGRARRQRRVRPEPGHRPPVDRDGRVSALAGRPRSTSCTGRSARSRAGCSPRSPARPEALVDVVPVDYVADAWSAPARGLRRDRRGQPRVRQRGLHC